MDIKIIVATHKKYWMPDDSIYLPLHVGCKGKEKIGYIGDNSGDNISEKNKNYCELTGLYWAWKNMECDYIGLCHYRRYFTQNNYHNSEEKKRSILNKEEYDNILKHCPIIVPDKRRYFIESNRSHYNHAHYKKDLDLTERIIKKMYPEYSEAFTLVMNRTWAHMFNMFVMRYDYFIEYCEWLFSILFELEDKVDISNYDPVEARIYGYISELMLDVWLEGKQLNFYEQNVSFLEDQNWWKKGGKFLMRKIWKK